MKQQQKELINRIEDLRFRIGSASDYLEYLEGQLEFNTIGPIKCSLGARKRYLKCMKLYNNRIEVDERMIEGLTTKLRETFTSPDSMSMNEFIECMRNAMALHLS